MRIRFIGHAIAEEEKVFCVRTLIGIARYGNDLFLQFDKIPEKSFRLWVKYALESLDTIYWNTRYSYIKKLQRFIDRIYGKEEMNIEARVNKINDMLLYCAKETL